MGQESACRRRVVVGWAMCAGEEVQRVLMVVEKGGRRRRGGGVGVSRVGGKAVGCLAASSMGEHLHGFCEFLCLGGSAFCHLSLLGVRLCLLSHLRSYGSILTSKLHARRMIIISQQPAIASVACCSSVVKSCLSCSSCLQVASDASWAFRASASAFIARSALPRASLTCTASSPAFKFAADSCSPSFASRAASFASNASSASRRAACRRS